MPALSPTMADGTILKWNFKEGDKIEMGDVICEIQTDKATVGFESQEEGYLGKIILPDKSTGVLIGEVFFIQNFKYLNRLLESWLNSRAKWAMQIYHLSQNKRHNPNKIK